MIDPPGRIVYQSGKPRGHLPASLARIIHKAFDDVVLMDCCNTVRSTYSLVTAGCIVRSCSSCGRVYCSRCEQFSYNMKTLEADHLARAAGGCQDICSLNEPIMGRIFPRWMADHPDLKELLKHYVEECHDREKEEKKASFLDRVKWFLAEGLTTGNIVEETGERYIPPDDTTMSLHSDRKTSTISLATVAQENRTPSLMDDIPSNIDDASSVSNTAFFETLKKPPASCKDPGDEELPSITTLVGKIPPCKDPGDEELPPIASLVGKIPPFTGSSMATALNMNTTVPASASAPWNSMSPGFNSSGSQNPPN